MGSRNRVAGYAAAVFEGLTIRQLEEIEDELFGSLAPSSPIGACGTPSGTATCRSPYDRV